MKMSINCLQSLSGHGLLGRFHMQNYASKTLGQRIVNVARHAVTFTNDGGLAALCGKTGELNRKHRLIGKRLSQLLLFIAKNVLPGKSYRYQSSYFAAYN